jgi:nitroreductase
MEVTMNLYEGIKKRQSIRGFLSKNILKEDIEEILEVAGNSPSYTNTQPWDIVLVSGAKKNKLSEKLLELATSESPTNPDIPFPINWPSEMEKRTREHGARRLKTLGIAREDKVERKKFNLMNYEFYGAPCAVFLFMDSNLSDWSLFDMGLFTQNFILAAYSKGIGSCIQASVTGYAEEIKKFLDIEKEKKLVVCISLGYPDFSVKLNSYCSIKKNLDEYFYWYE